MNRLKGLKLKFDVTDNPELSEAIQKRVFELGGHWLSDRMVPLYLNAPVISVGSDMHGDCRFGWSDKHNDDAYTECTLSTLDDLYHLPKTHTITIDGKDIELSAESFAELKAQLT